MSDDEVIDVRTSAFRLTEHERTLLQTIVDRNVIDVAELGRALGTSDEGVFAVMHSIADKLDEYRYLAADRTPPLGNKRINIARRRRRAALRAERHDA